MRGNLNLNGWLDLLPDITHVIFYRHPCAAGNDRLNQAAANATLIKMKMKTVVFGYLGLIIRKSCEKNRTLFKGKADQSQTESYEVFHYSKPSYQQILSTCFFYIFIITTSQTSWNTVIFNVVNFCRNFKDIRPGQSVINNFTIFDILCFSLNSYYFNILQIKF